MIENKKDFDGFFKVYLKWRYFVVCNMFIVILFFFWFYWLLVLLNYVLNIYYLIDLDIKLYILKKSGIYEKSILDNM